MSKRLSQLEVDTLVDALNTLRSYADDNNAVTEDILKNQVAEGANVRVIDGNPLTGTRSCMDGYLGGHTSEVTVIPEGDDADEMLGWILPRLNQFSVNRSYFSWLT